MAGVLRGRNYLEWNIDKMVKISRAHFLENVEVSCIGERLGYEKVTASAKSGWLYFAAERVGLKRKRVR